MLRNREGHLVELSLIEKVEEHDDSYSITKDNSWTFGVSKSDLGGYVPQVGDTILTAQSVNTIAGIVIEGHVARWWDQAKVDADHEQWKKNLRLKRLEEYIEKGDELKARAAALPKPLRERMERFANDPEDGGIEFWIESAGYELYALEGVAALLRKVVDLGFIDDVDNPRPDSEFGPENADRAVQWIEDWWDINSDKHDPPYDYKKQMEMVPDFGDGHSGWTASAAKGLAVVILKGEPV